MFERRAEVGLMKALGAANSSVASVFFAETGLLCFFSGLVGFVAGTFLAHQIGWRIFGSNIEVAPVLLPVVLLLSAVVALAGSATAIRRAVKLDPVFALRGEA
jgi:putative ABC transport system permease protein